MTCRNFLEVINYLGKFIPNLTEHATPLRILKKDVFKLQKPQFDATENLNTFETSAPSLKILDSKLPTRSKTDASSVGLDAFLDQNYETINNESITLLTIHHELYGTTKNVTYR